MLQELQIIGASNMGGSEQRGVSSGTPPSSPELLPLDRPVSSRKGNKELLFKDAGRDFHNPNIEAAMLSALLNDKSVAEDFAQLLDKEDFHLSKNRTIFAAFLHLFVESGSVSREALEGYLSETVSEFNASWQRYIDECMATQFNPNKLGDYVIALKEAAQVRGGGGYCVSSFSELFYTDRLRANLPPTFCVDNAWYQYREGIWSPKDKNVARKVAVESIHPNHRKAKRVRDVMDLAEAAMQVPADTFAGAYRISEGEVLINVANGIIAVMADGAVQFRDHDPEMHFTAKLAASYDPDASCPLFARTLQEALPDEADRILLQRFVGYILLPECKYELALVCYGPSGTGKSTIVLFIRHVLGESVCSSTGLEELCKSGSYSLPTLKHKMLNLGSELRSQEIDESSNFKQLVSGEPLMVRQIYGTPMEMQTTCKLVFLSNNMPRFRSGTDAETRRLRMLHFNQKPPKPDPDLKEKLKNEASGVLNWMLQGLAGLLREQAIPEGGEASKRLLENFNKSNDPVGAFVAEKCELEASFTEIKQNLADAFAAWCGEAGIQSDKMENFFFKTLKSRYPDLKDSRPSIKSTGKRGRCFSGIRLKETYIGDGVDCVITPLHVIEELNDQYHM